MSKLNRLFQWIWRITLSCLLLFAIALAGLRLSVIYLPSLQPHIIEYFNNKLNADLSIEQLESSWNQGRPLITLNHLRLQGSQSSQPAVTIQKLNVQFDLKASLLHQSLVFNTVDANGIVFNVILNNEPVTEWMLEGIPVIRKKPGNRSSGFIDRLITWLNIQGDINLNVIQINISQADNPPSRLENITFQLKNTGNIKQFKAYLAQPQGFISTQAQGIKDDKNNIKWQGVTQASHFIFDYFQNFSSQYTTPVNQVHVNLDTEWEYDQSAMSINGEVDIPSASYLKNNGTQSFLSGSTWFLLKKQPQDGWKAWLDNTEIKTSSATASFNRLYLQSETDKTGKSFAIATDTIELSPLKQLLLDVDLLPALPTELLSTLNPSGSLHKLAFKLSPRSNSNSSLIPYQMAASLDDVSIDAYRGAPSAEHINGTVRMNEREGYLDVNSTDFSLGLTKIFRNKWQFTQADMRLYWRIHDHIYELRSDNIRLKNSQENLAGKLHLDIPLQGKDPIWMELTVGMSQGSVTSTSQYLPARNSSMSPALVKWLDNAMISGDIKEGGFLFNGPLRPEPGRWGLFFSINNTRLHYADDWPDAKKLDAEVIINNNKVAIQASRGTILDNTIEQLSATVPLSDPVVLHITSQLSSSNDAVSKLLNETPLNNALNNAPKSWRINGDFSTRLRLDIPLDKPENTQVKSLSTTTNSEFSLPDYKIKLSDIHGTFAFNTRSGFSSEAFSASLFEQPVHGNISTIDTKEQKTTTISWKSIAEMAQLQQWSGLSWLDNLRGKTGYQGKITINGERAPFTLKINSQLDGISSTFPDLFYKKDKTSELPFSLTFQDGEETRKLTLALQNRIKGAVLLDDTNTLEGAALLLGNKSTHTSTDLPAVLPERIRIAGELSSLNISDWKTLIEKQRPKGKSIPFSLSMIRIDKLKIEQIIYDTMKWTDTTLSLQSTDKTTTLTVDNPQIAGTLQGTQEHKKPYIVNIKRLHIPDTWLQTDRTDQKDSWLSSLDLSTIPEADITIDSLKTGKNDKGATSFTVRQSEQGIIINDIYSQLAGMSLTGSMKWQQKKPAILKPSPQFITYFSGSLTGKHIDKLQESMDIPTFLQAEKSRIDMTIEWPSSPLDLDFQQLKGSMELNIKKGLLKKLEGGSGALKLFGILNTDSLIRRLKLDFSDLYESGISFDEISGQLDFSNGLVSINEPIEIKGPSSDFALSGIIDAKKETINANMIVTIPLSSNLPILSVLLGTAPQVAGIIYIADKLVGKQVDKLASVRYKISGTFDDPEVNIDKLFTNQLKSPDKNKDKKKKNAPSPKTVPQRKPR
ncbi:hypothetical protein CI610_01045 [invertebrate metagenome]|uniref:YhdP central domain-containing protein n=1 Tax=invertebrate metagenome TaxID=1711999 RepID=A0A2H9T9V1_9ZZZZ